MVPASLSMQVDIGPGSNSTWDVPLPPSSGKQQQQNANVTLFIRASAENTFEKAFASFRAENRSDLTYNFCDLVTCPVMAGSNITFSVPLRFNGSYVKKLSAGKVIQFALWEVDQTNTVSSLGCWNMTLQLPSIPSPDSLSTVSIVTITFTSMALILSLIASIAWHIVLRDSETTHFELSPTGGVALTLTSADDDTPYARTPFPTFTDFLLHCQFIAALGMMTVRFPKPHFDLVRVFGWFVFLFGYFGIDRAAYSVQNLGGASSDSLSGSKNNSVPTTTSSLASSTLVGASSTITATTTTTAIPTSAVLAPCSPETPGPNGICNIEGYCCSVSGYCGTGPEYCGNGGGPPFAPLSGMLEKRQQPETTSAFPTADLVLPTSVTFAPRPTSITAAVASTTISIGGLTATPGINATPPSPSPGIDKFVIDSLSHLTSGGNALGSSLIVTTILVVLTCTFFLVAIPVGWGWVRWWVSFRRSRGLPVRSGSSMSIRHSAGAPGPGLGRPGSGMSGGTSLRYVVDGEGEVSRSTSALGLTGDVEKKEQETAGIMRVLPNERLFTEKAYLIRFGSIYASYKPATLFFFIVPFAHRTVLALMVGGIRNATVQVSVTVTIEALHLTTLLVFSPHSRPIGNVLAIILACTRCIAAGLLFPYVLAESSKTEGTPFSVEYAGWCSVGIQIVVLMAFGVSALLNLFGAVFRILKRDLGGTAGGKASWKKAMSGPSFFRKEGFSAAGVGSVDGEVVRVRPLSSPGATPVPSTSSSAVSLSSLAGERSSRTAFLHHSQSQASMSSDHPFSGAPPRPDSVGSFGVAAKARSSATTAATPAPAVSVARSFLEIEAVSSPVSNGGFLMSVKGPSASPAASIVTERSGLSPVVGPREALEKEPNPVESPLEKKSLSDSVLSVFKRAITFSKAKGGAASVIKHTRQPTSSTAVDYDLEGLDTYIKTEKTASAPFGILSSWGAGLRGSHDYKREDSGVIVPMHSMESRKGQGSTPFGNVRPESRDMAVQADFLEFSAGDAMPTVPPLQNAVSPLGSVLMVSHLPPSSSSSPSPSIASLSSYRASVLSTSSLGLKPISTAGIPPLAGRASPLPPSPRQGVPPWLIGRDLSPVSKRPNSAPPLNAGEGVPPFLAARKAAGVVEPIPTHGSMTRLGERPALPWEEPAMTSRPLTPIVERPITPVCPAPNPTPPPPPPPPPPPQHRPPPPRLQTRPSSYQAGQQAQAMVATAMIIQTPPDETDSLFSTLPRHWGTLASTVTGSAGGTVERGSSPLETPFSGRLGQGGLTMRSGVALGDGEVIERTGTVTRGAVEGFGMADASVGVGETVLGVPVPTLTGEEPEVVLSDALPEEPGNASLKGGAPRVVNPDVVVAGVGVGVVKEEGGEEETGKMGRSLTVSSAGSFKERMGMFGVGKRRSGNATVGAEDGRLPARGSSGTGVTLLIKRLSGAWASEA
ncbi:hypothetical protein HDU67_008067 [Dinochytrium kinnereticum]|nr:hypothetical protein HDU67_008067 [Dinochytrium kinnereticum]